MARYNENLEKQIVFMFLVGWEVQLGAQVGSKLGGLGPTLGHLGSKVASWLQVGVSWALMGSMLGGFGHYDGVMLRIML